MWSFADLAGKSVYLDTNVLIYSFETAADNDDPMFQTMKGLLEHLESGHARAHTSRITYAEVMVAPMREDNSQLIELYEALLSGTTFLRIHPISEPVIYRATRLRSAYGLRLGDALHVASALVTGCDAFLTGDKRLTACANEINVKLLHELTLD